jgi:hypothetical protein
VCLKTEEMASQHFGFRVLHVLNPKKHDVHHQPENSNHDGHANEPFLFAFDNYSMISKTALFFNFFATPDNIVRIAFAVRPYFPITFPMSSLTTFNSIIEAVVPSI